MSCQVTYATILQLERGAGGKRGEEGTHGEGDELADKGEHLRGKEKG